MGKPSSVVLGDFPKNCVHPPVLCLSSVLCSSTIVFRWTNKRYFNLINVILLEFYLDLTWWGHTGLN